MLLSLFLVCVISLSLATILLLALGRRLQVAFRLLGVLLAAGVAFVGGWAAGRIWDLPPGQVRAGQVLVFAVMSIVVASRPQWNPIGQTFYGAFLASALVYLIFATYFTFGTGLSVPAMAASALLLVLEFIALVLSATFAFESCDVICRVKWPRPISDPDPSYQPFVSLQIAAYNEPSDMLIQTIQSLEAIDYPSFEVVVIDNNTKDPEVWQPVDEYCRGRERVHFVHVDDLPGYKAGALNLVLREHTDPQAELIGVIDADYLVDPGYLKSVAGYFADDNVAFVQTPQDYRDYEGDPYLEACYDAYKYFFATTMPSRNQRNSIIFAGTMGLLRRELLEKLGGWNEWCITEDAETSLRLLMLGYSGIYINKSFGRGIMPLTFAALKSQRFRWCFGGMQILRMHWRDLMPWSSSRENHLSPAQRIDYLLGSVQWMNDLVYLGFTVVLLVSAGLLATNGRIALRPLLGAAVLLPAALIASGLVRALWALRVRTRIGLRRAILAFANWLSLSWTVALACVQGLVRKHGVFMRTPKTGERRDPLSAIWTAKSETAIAGLLWAGAILAARRSGSTPFVLGLLAWQGAVYATAPFMSWLNTRTRLPEQLERRRHTEWMRDRFGAVAPYVAGVAATVLALGLVAAFIGFGGSHPGPGARNPFVIPHSSPARHVTPTPSPTVSPSVSPSPTVSPTPPLTTPSPSSSPSPS
jgi:cellulose synthase/poly-beta-1,6-N-acetylglucosamine synthase-like glycosyltransferase